MAGNIFQGIKQAMDMRTQMKKMQKAMEEKQFDYLNAGVKITVNGGLSLVSVEIDPSVVDTAKIEKLNRTVLENTNKALKLAKDYAQQEAAKMTKEMGLDGLLGGLR